MMPLIARIAKRLAVLLVGAFFVYLAVRKVFPFFDNRTPGAIALFITYVVMAYFIIPALFRVFRFFYHPKHLPLYCVTPDGFASDPVNIGLVGTRRQVILAMEAGGWYLADSKTLVNVLRQIAATLFHHSYPSAPVSNLYLFGRTQDLAFEKEIKNSLGHRHHVRFWAADAALAGEHASHAKFWGRFHRPNRAHPNTQFWVGAASKDVGLAPIRHNAQLTHMIDPNTNRERRLIVQDLKRAKMIVRTRTKSVGKPFALKNRAWRGFLHTDGQITICTLR